MGITIQDWHKMFNQKRKVLDRGKKALRAAELRYQLRELAKFY